MSPQRFEIGQAVTPRKDKREWAVISGPNTSNAPKDGEVYHVSSYCCLELEWYIGLSEFGGMDKYLENDFEPVITDSQLEQLLETVPQTETV